MSTKNSRGKKKTLYLVRHAHRDKDQGQSADNGLSKKGQKQSEELLKYFRKRLGDGAAPQFYSSPKLRCRETLAPLAEKLGAKVNTLPILDEIADGEAPEDFEKRVESFVTGWCRSEPTITFACSHGDWIPVALGQISGSETQLKKGGFAEIIFDPDHDPKNPRVENIVQSVD